MNVAYEIYDDFFQDLCCMQEVYLSLSPSTLNSQKGPFGSKPLFFRWETEVHGWRVE